MNILVTFRGMEHSNTLEEFVVKKLEKVVKFLENEPLPVTIDVVLIAQPQHKHHSVEMRLNSPHYHIIAKREGPEIYAEVEEVAEIFAHDLAKAKQKRVDELKRRTKLSELEELD